MASDAGPPPVTVRPAASEDTPDIARINIEGWHQAYRGILPDADLDSLDWEARTAMWLDILSRPGEWLVSVAVADGAVVGFAAGRSQSEDDLRRAGYEGELSALYVSGPWQGRGIAARLVTDLARRFEEKGFSGMSLWVFTANHKARSFYEKMGAVLIRERVQERAATRPLERAMGWVRFPGCHPRSR